jgi:hypothetical protein
VTAPLRLTAILAALAMTPVLMSAVPAAAQDDDDAHCTTIHMQRGTDRIVLQGRLTQERASYCYRFKARAGQVLKWSLSGPATRLVIGYPDGNGDGPGIPERIELTQTGAYTFTVGANLMADGAFGHFRLTMVIR